MAKKPTTSVKQAKQHSKKLKQRNNSGKRGPGREAGYKNLIGQTFKEKPERINKKGRPPKLVNDFNEEMKANGYEPLTDSQLLDAYKILLQLPEEEFRLIILDKKQPYFLRLVAKYMGSARGMEMLDRLLDRSFGKAKQFTESEHHHSGNINHLHKIQDIPIDELSEGAQELVFEITKKQLITSNREN